MVVGVILDGQEREETDVPNVLVAEEGGILFTLCTQHFTWSFAFLKNSC